MHESYTRAKTCVQNIYLIINDRFVKFRIIMLKMRDTHVMKITKTYIY